MADIIDIANERAEAEREAILARRKRLTGESAEECRDCGEEIPEARREAVPGVTRCVACAEIVEARR